ncbi:hypothetical protein QYE76_038507 [Lolium multiflorum]|uniref:RNase H type-1 domain-containing protein n=1 Tax=Lolium multiflorum TaxID=4521 RepID=A0AAD8WRB6_LOLMU|nr:hypothetical protein QYE76_038507 [Lolium multiflorum]
MDAGGLLREGQRQGTGDAPIETAHTAAELALPTRPPPTGTAVGEPVEEEIDEPESSLDEKEEEIDEPESSLDEKEEESDEQKEEEWISYPCQPSNESNSLSLTLFDCPPCLRKEVECYVPVDSLEIVPMSNTCENDYATVIYDNPCYFDKSYDNALFVPDVEMHEWMELQNTGPPDLSRTWTMNFDGSKRLEGAGAGVILVSPEGDKLKYVLRMTFPNASNNEAEYEALIHGMKMAKACGATRMKIFGDSQLVAQQVMNQCDAVNESMIAYKEVYNELEKLFDGCEVNHISRLSNDEADVLANIGSQCLAIPPGVFWEEISEISTKPVKIKKKEKEGKFSSTTKDLVEEEEEQELWIEAKPINSPDGASAIKFVKSIVVRFGVPHSIVTDNGINFTSKEFKAYWAEVGIN